MEKLAEKRQEIEEEKHAEVKMLSSGKKISPRKKRKAIGSRSKEPVRSSPTKTAKTAQNGQKQPPKSRAVKPGHRRTRTLTSTTRSLHKAGKSKSKT